MLDQTVKQLIFFTRASEFEDIPDVPGIYAWFLPLEGDDTGSLKVLLDSLLARLASSNQLTVAEGESGQHRISIQRAIPENLDRENLPDLSSHQIQKTARLLKTCSFLSSPIYIGMTVKMGLRSRIKSHLANPGDLNDENWCGSFRSRVAWQTGQQRFLETCMIAYLPMSPDDIPEPLVRVFEQVLIKTIRPTQSIR
jgi:hypothetical protein